MRPTQIDHEVFASHSRISLEALEGKNARMFNAIGIAG